MYSIEDFIYGTAPLGSSMLCPFHGDTRPSAVIHPDSGMFYCYVCHERGDQTQIAAKYYFSEFSYAIAMTMARELIQHERITLVKGSGAHTAPEPAVLEIVNLWQKTCNKELQNRPSLIQRLQEERSVFKPLQLGIGYATYYTFRKFYDALPVVLRDERLLIQAGLLKPHMDPAILPHRKFRLDEKWILPEIRSGKACYYTARDDGSGLPKYLNPPYQRTFYGYDSLKPNNNYVWLLEGAFDMYPLIEHGESAVAINGASYSQNVLDEVLDASKSKIVLIAFDNDMPNSKGVSVGQEAARKCLEDVKLRGRQAAIIVPKAKDMGEWITRTSIGNVIADVTWNLQLL
jgi:DNA primase